MKVYLAMEFSAGEEERLSIHVSALGARRACEKDFHSVDQHGHTLGWEDDGWARVIGPQGQRGQLVYYVEEVGVLP